MKNVIPETRFSNRKFQVRKKLLVTLFKVFVSFLKNFRTKHQKKKKLIQFWKTWARDLSSKIQNFSRFWLYVKKSQNLINWRNLNCQFFIPFSNFTPLKGKKSLNNCISLRKIPQDRNSQLLNFGYFLYKNFNIFEI